MVDLARMNRVLAVDGDEVTVEAGITLRELGPQLAARGLAMENQGDVDPQSIAGAISTATHGTGARFRNLSAQVARAAAGHRRRARSLDLRDGDELLAGRVSLGALGVISARDAALRAGCSRSTASTSRVRSTTCSRGSTSAFDANDHFELFVFPYTRTALTLTSERTDRAAAPARRGRGLRARGAGRERRARARLPPRPPPSGRDPGAQPARRGVDEPRRAPRPQPPRLRQPPHRALHRDGVRDPAARTWPRRSSACWRWSSGAGCRSASRSRCAPRRRTTPCCPRPTGRATGLRRRPPVPRDGVRELLPRRRGDHGRATAAARTGASATTSRPPRCGLAIPGWDRFHAVRDRLDPGRKLGNDYLRRVLG